MSTSNERPPDRRRRRPLTERSAESAQALHRRIEDLTTDIGSVLHANTSTLMMSHSALDVAIRALGPNPFAPDKAPTAQEVDAMLAQPTQATVRALEKLVPLIVAPERADALPPELAGELADEFREHGITLADYTTHIPVEESRTSALRSLAHRIQDLLDQVPAGVLPREPVRNLRRAAREVERITALATLMQTRAAILQMDYSIRSFREFVTADLRRPEQRQRLKVAALIDTAHRQLADYALASNVEVRPRIQAPGVAIMGVERELVRAFANLLHNAIKYSWRRDGDQRPWVDILVQRQDGQVSIAFENWGVPVSSQEIDEGMVFELGYRGKWSTDRGRLGTGIGLTDSRDVAEKHRGTLVIRSRPARSWGPDDPEQEEYYRQPFITTVTVCIPEAL